MSNGRVKYSRPSRLQGVELLSCQDADFNFPRHFHPAYCIWLNINGGEHYFHNGNTGILQPTEFGIVAPGEVHANNAIDHTNRNLMTFYVQTEQLEKIAAQIDEKSSPAIEFRSQFYQDTECLRLLVRLFTCLQSSTSAMEQESAFLEVFSLLSCRHAAVSPQQNPVGIDKTRVRRIIEILHDRLAENVSLNELSCQLDCTPYYLIRFFKKVTGLTPYAYLQHLRLEQARELIWQGDQLVEVALETGFSDQSHLTRHFKAHFGITPGEYKRQSQNH